MSNRTAISELPKHLGEEITIKGWLFQKRSSGKLHFLQIRDGSAEVQAVVFKNDVTPEVFALADKITQESSVEITGIVNAHNRSKIGVELSVKDVKLIAESVDYPITPKEHGVAFLMENRHLWLRAPRQRAILKVRNEIIKSIRDFFYDRDFTLVDAPIFTPSACEGTTNLFETTYFDQKAYLSQSGQLYMEAAAMALGKVYCFGPTFRAEKSKTRRHLTEFWMVEPEMAFYDLDADMELAEEFVSHIVQSVVAKCKDELEVLERDVSKLENIKAPFPRISYDEAIEILKRKGHDVRWGDDFGADEETAISEEFELPVMIHHYPAECKAFYMKQDEQNPKTVKCVDMIAPEGYGEIIGGAQREDNLDILLAKLKEHNLSQEAFEWYLDLRRYGSVEHAGFGLGIERTVAWICGLHHVRETIPFPRLMDRIKP
jgi:asparaginyl-tRNA synthetase